MGDEIILLDFWPSMFGARVRIALAEKDIKYEHREEDLLMGKRSELLQKMNPVHNKIPVLIHNGKPVCESTIAMEYIDEVWKGKSPSLLPSDPYERSKARFWANYIDQKIFVHSRKIWASNGEEQEASVKEYVSCLKVLEGVLGDKAYLGGESFGFVDACLIGFYPWFHVYESFGKFSTEAECPKIVAWAKRCMQRKSVAKSLLDDAHQVYQVALKIREFLGVV